MNQRLSRPRTFARRFAGAFTLVELLTVMAIMSVLLAVTVPAIKGINGTGGRKSAVRTIMGALDQARMLAISDGHATYVVFAGKTLDGMGTVAPSMIGRAYAIYEDTGDFTPVQKSAWLFTPVGIAFKVNDGGSGPSAPTDFSSLTNRSMPSADADQSFPVTTTVTGANGPSTLKLPYVKFDATGAVDSSISSADSLFWRVLVFEGIMNPDGSDTPTRQAGANNKMLLYDEVRINPATGRARYTLDPADNLTTSNN